MAFTTIAEVRNSTNKLTNGVRGVAVTDATIQDRINEASDILVADLSKVASAADLIAMGSTSKVLNQLATYKSVEKSLVFEMGASRQADIVTDIQYWQGEYRILLDKVLNGDVELTDGTDTLSATSIPVGTPTVNNAKMYPEKGVPGFTNDGAKTDIVDDRIK